MELQLANHLVAGEHLVLHPHRALYWPRHGLLAVSDLHLGKAAHFRKAGAALPEGQDAATLQRLDALIKYFAPVGVLFLGDLFHSYRNRQWQRFGHWAAGQRTRLHLVVGNHDLLTHAEYVAAGLTVVPEYLSTPPVIWSHHPMEHAEGYSIAGHVHPGIALRLTSRQQVRLPCFLFGQRGALLPAFGLSTGTYPIQPAAGDAVFACTERRVMPV